MINLCVFCYLAIIVIFDSVFADHDVTLIFESINNAYNANCVIGGNALNTAIYLAKNNGQPLTSHFSSRYVPHYPQINFYENNEQWGIGGLNMALCGPVTDERWEMFQTFKLNETKSLWSGNNFTSISVSVFISNVDYRIYFGNNYYVEIDSHTSSVAETATIDIKSSVRFKKPYEVWLHFTITKIKTEMKITFFPNKEQIAWNVTDSENLSFIKISKGIKSKNEPKPGFWKLHECKYLYSEVRHEKTHEIGNIKHTGELCIAMFVAVCDSCSLNIILDVDRKKIDDNFMVTSEENQKGHYLWKKMVIKQNITVKNNIKLYVQKINPKGSSGFWAISNIRICDSSEVRVISINNKHSRNDINCHSLVDPNFRISGSGVNSTTLSCNDVWQLGKSCNISCQSIFQKKDYCGNTICIDSGCFCSWGFHGENCNKGCDKNFWGQNCTNKCGKCINNEACNRFDGTCNGCEKYYTGIKCAGSLPFLTSKPIAANLSHTSITISIKKEDIKGSYSPIRVLVQHRKKNVTTWDTSCEVDYKNFQICYIPNLSSATMYEIRAVLVANEGLLDADVDTPILEVNTTCKDINIDTFDVKPEQFTAQVISSSMDSTLCKLNTYTVKLLEPNNQIRYITDINSSIERLLPCTNYTISFCNNSTTCSIKKTFRTKPSGPGKVSNISWTSSSENISLVWSAPSECGEDMNYTIKYKLVRHIACGKNITQSPEEQKSVNESQIVLQNLITYSNYEISILATNEVDHGTIENITAATKEADDIRRDELPINVTEIDGEIQIIPPSCEKVKGNLQYTIKYIFNDDQLCNEARNYSVNVTYENRIMKLNQSQALIPYSKYLVTILARRNEDSLEYIRNYQYKSKPSKPPKVKNLTVYSKNGTHVWLRWMAPCPSNGQLEEYSVNVINNNGALKPSRYTFKMIQTTCLWEHEECVVIKNLTQNQSYKFKVQAKNQDVADYGDANIIEAKACEEEPNPPKNLTYQFKTENLLLKWIHPDVTNGPLQTFQIDGYVVESESESAHNISEEYSIEMDQLHYNKTLNATPATEFHISVTAINSKKGKPAFIKVIVPPPEPKLSHTPSISSCSEGTCSINIPPLDSDSFCIDCSFYVVVCNKTGENTSSPFLETPFYEKISKNEENNKILRYQHWIAANNSFKNVEQNIPIGRAVGGKPVYNDSNYLLHIIFVSSYKGKYNTKTYYLDYGIQKSKVNGLYYLLLLLVIPLAVLSFFAYRFYTKNKEESKKEQTSSNAIAPLMKNAERIPEDNYPLMRLPPLAPKPNISKVTKNKYSKVIELSNLKSYLKEAAGGDTTHSQLSKQHEMCKGGYNKPVEIGSKEINKKKNRYKDLIAYDHTRVKLKRTDENGSDYINANYIDGYGTKNAYIATQGPKANTVNDFWHMIWEQNVGNIVMLANVIENGKKKCEEYWPALNQTMKFQDIVVQNIKTNVFSSYIYRELQVTCKGNKRIINHLHFTQWPDHGIPLYPQNLVPFMREMLKIPQAKNPIVVHCSAGIGRTGTILLCDIVLRMAALEQKLDFLNIYHQLREQRPNMVDNSAQYILAHLVVYECLFGKDFSIQLDGNFTNRVENLLTDASIKSMMDYLEEVSWQIKIMQECFNNELSDVNKEKNRFSTILPGCSQIYLERYPVDDASSDYINAVSMDCFQYQDRFVVTQQPLPNTVGDFWRLILQYDVNTIVSLNEIQQKDKTSCIFWPKRNESFYPVDYIKVAYQNEEDRGNFNVITVEITDENENTRRSVSLICLNGWLPETSTPADPTGILAVRDYMFNTTFGHDNLIVVACYDGAKASGLFVALSFLIEKIKLEHSCDVILAVSTVRQRRMQCIRDKEQFKFLLKAALLYLESFEMYSNFDNL